MSITLLAPALILACAWIFKDAIVEWWHRIPVTRTWGDLQSQWPIDLGNGVKVRLGIEATRCPQWSGVLVYCLAEGNEEYEDEFPELLVDPLGPLHICVIEEGRTHERNEDSRPEKILYSGTQASSRAGRTSPLLFAKAIPIPRPGRYEVQVSTRDGRLLRKTTIHGTTEPFHPWMPLDSSPGHIRRLHRGMGVFAGAIANRGGGSALPEWDGRIPYPQPRTMEGLAIPHHPLPGLFPRSPEPEISLAVEGEQLILTSQHNLLATGPKDHFLCRWWINGEPYIPDPRSRLSRLMEESGGPRISRISRISRSIRLELDFDPARIGAGSGDRIGLQLLYLDHGWELIDLWDRIERLAFQNTHHRDLLTNRVEFTAP